MKQYFDILYTDFYFQDCPRFDLTRPNYIVRLDTTFDCVWVVCTSTIQTGILWIGDVTGRIELLISSIILCNSSCLCSIALVDLDGPVNSLLTSTQPIKRKRNTMWREICNTMVIHWVSNLRKYDNIPSSYFLHTQKHIKCSLSFKLLSGDLHNLSPPNFTHCHTMIV